MDFFEHQDKARRKTGQLVLMFTIGVVATIAAVNVVVFLAYWLFTSSQFTAGGLTAVGSNSLLSAWQQWWGSNLNWQVSWGVLGAVVIGTVFRFIELAGGGRKVAEWAGAKPVDMTSKDDRIRQFINVCEEMAIAAGMPVPELYVMNREPAINAFVAGYKTNNAVLVVTQGALEQLSRDELQGVIAHEYSHILNGDMRLNVRLMAFLAGLVMIGQIGRFFLYANMGSRRRSYGSSRNNDGRAAIIFIGLGLLLMAVGYIGVLVGRMIKAAVSRQREYLADASSVQFTRNPDGLAGALYAISKASEGSRLNHQHAEDMSHFCFGETVALSSRLATHPPIQDRIRRINPNFIAKTRTKERLTETAEQSVARHQPQAFDTVMQATGFMAMVGQVSPNHVLYAQGLFKHIPEQIKDWIHQSSGAKAYLYSQILLGTDDKGRQQVLNRIKEEDPSVMPMLKQLWPYCQKMDDQLRLPVLELAIPTMRRFSEPDRVVLLDRLDRLVKVDGRVDFIEWTILTLIKLRLDPKANDSSERLANSLDAFKPAVAQLLTSLVDESPNRAIATQALDKITNQLSLPSSPAAIVGTGYERLSDALMKLDGVSFMWRKVVLEACVDIVQSDGRIEFKEYETLRLVAECLQCPVPPLMMAAEFMDPRDQPIPFQ